MIGTLKEGTQMAGIALVLERKEGTTKTGSPYLDLTLGDKSGSIECKLWGYDYSIHGPLKEGTAVNVHLSVGTYNGRLQGKIGTITESDIDPQSLVKGSRFAVDDMIAEIMGYVDSFTEPMTKKITTSLLNLDMSTFRRSPAAVGNHNNWPGGLVEHIWSMCRIASHIADHYKEQYKVKISRDKVLFGIICHDLGKIIEYDCDGITVKYAAEGVLVPHIVTTIGWVWSAAYLWFKDNQGTMTVDEFTRERNHLVHIVAAHHGKEEWGSPVKPATLEAILVHQIDMVDSKFMHALGLIEGRPGNLEGFSEMSKTEKTSYMLYNVE